MVKPRVAKSPKPQAAPEAPRFVCVHGHFYQPPRENPWLETIEVQDSAAPYHDWNERITAECYAPNGASRITNKQDEIIRIVNNYARMSYNFGPTLLSWLDDKAPRTYRMILDADKASAAALQRTRLSASHRSTTTSSCRSPPTRRPHPDPLGHRRLRAPFRSQARRHVARRNRHQSQRPRPHGRRKESSSPSSRPHQCARVRKLSHLSSPSPPADEDSAADTQPFPGPKLPTLPSIPPTPISSGSTKAAAIAVFFYDGPRSRAIAFEGLLNSGKDFARRLLSNFDARSPGFRTRNSPTSPPTAKATATTTSTAKWRSPTPCNSSKDDNHAAPHQLRRVPRKISAQVGGRGRR